MVLSSSDPFLPEPTHLADSGPEAEALPLLSRIRALEMRVAALEGVRTSVSAPEPVPLAEPGPEAIPGGTVLGLAGRTCLILGGAFLIRASTDSGALPAPAGVALGLGYAAFWALQAHRSASKGQGPWAAFQVFSAMAVAFPLLWETTVRLKAMPPGLAAAAMLLWTALFMAVAIRHDLRRMAWITALGSLATAFCIMAATSAIVAFCTFFLLASSASLLLVDREPWQALRWPAALAADLALLAMTLLTLSPGGSEDLVRDLRPGLVLATSLAFVAVHLGPFLVRILNRPRAVGGYEIFQTLAVGLVGFGGAVLVARASGLGLLPLGAGALLLGLACYGCAFAFVARQTEGSLDFKYITTLAIALVLAGSLLVLGPQALALVCLASGLATTLLGVRYGKFSLQFHGALFLSTAALASGLVAGTARAFLAPLPPGLGVFTPVAFLTLASLAGAHLYPLERRGTLPLPWSLRLPSLAFGALAFLALGGLAAAGLGTFVTDPGLLVSLRTCLLVAMAVAAAGMGRWKTASELVWLAYPILGCAVLKLVLDDLPNGKPASLFLAFTFFGAGLLLVPKILKKP